MKLARYAIEFTSLLLLLFVYIKIVQTGCLISDVSYVFQDLLKLEEEEQDLTYNGSTDMDTSKTLPGMMAHSRVIT